MFSPQTSLHYSQNKENPSGKLFRQARSVFRPTEDEPMEKQLRRGFVRLDSLEGDCRTSFSSPQHKKRPDHFDDNLETLKLNMDLKQPPTKAETKWFSHSDDSSPSYSPYKPKKPFSSSAAAPSPVSPTSFYQSFYESGPFMGNSVSKVGHHFHQTPAPIQLPYNLTKGQYECWATVPTTHQQLGHHGPFFHASPPPQTQVYASTVPVHMAQSTMSWFGAIGGVVDWLIGSSGFASDCKISQDNKQSQNLSSPVGGVASPATSSTLNPNAKVFTPPLNPNAKEFTPAKRDKSSLPSTTSSVSPSTLVHASPAFTTTATSPAHVTSSGTRDTTPCNDNSSEKQNNLEVSSSNVTPSGSACVTPSGSACVTPAPDMEAPLRATTDRLCTPWVQQGDKSARQFDETDEEILECDEEDDDNIYDDDSNESDCEASSDEDEDEEIALSGKAENTSIVDGVEDRFRFRQRSLSSCSDESFIEFTASSPGESPVVVNCDRKSSSTKKVEKPRFDVSVDSDDESEESEEDEDWDEIDEANVDDEDFNEKMTSFGFVCPLLVPSFTSSDPPAPCSSVASSPPNGRKAGKRFVIENVASSKCNRTSCGDDSYPSGRLPKEDLDHRLRVANDVWNQNYDETQDKEGQDVVGSKNFCSKHTTFSPSEDWEEIYEDPLYSEDLRLSRTSDNARRRADHERMERLMAPIFAEDHRQKMRELIEQYNNSCSSNNLS